MTAIPITRFDGWLKQIALGSLDDLQRLAVDVLFPGFAPPDREAVDRSVVEARQTSLATHVIGEYVNRRRFAGDWTLPRARYYTVAKDQSGFDYGTLLAELAAYNDWAVGPASLEEFFSSAKAAEQGVEYRPQCVIVRLGGSPGSSAALARIGRQTVLIPYQVRQERIDDVLDLRVPDAQRWMCMQFRDINYVALTDLGLSGPVASPTFQPASFLEMLPTLMTLERGGNRVTDIIGAWLRRHGVAALIYPTARKAAGVGWRDDRMVGFAGWDLVDYRAAGEVFLDHSIFLGNPWTDRFPPEYRVQQEPDGQTWQITPPRVAFYRTGVVCDGDLRSRFSAGAEIFNQLFEAAWSVSATPTLSPSAIVAASQTERGGDVLDYMGIAGVRVHSFEKQDAVLFECSTAVMEEKRLSKGFAYLELPPQHTVTALDSLPEGYRDDELVVVELEANMYIYFLREPVRDDS